MIKVKLTLQQLNKLADLLHEEVEYTDCLCDADIAEKNDFEDLKELQKIINKAIESETL